MNHPEMKYSEREKDLLLEHYNVGSNLFCCDPTFLSEERLALWNKMHKFVFDKKQENNKKQENDNNA